MTSKETVVLTLTASGSVSDYSDTSSLQQSIATSAGVDKSQVMVSTSTWDYDMAASSVIITATITVPASTTAAAVQISLSSSLGTAAAASAALGITVESDPAISLPVGASPSPPPPPAPGVIELGELCPYTDRDLANDGDCSGTGPKSLPEDCVTVTDEFLNTCKANEVGGANQLTCDSTGLLVAIHANADCSDDASTQCVYSYVDFEWSSPSGCFFRFKFDTCTETRSYLGQGQHAKYTGTCPKNKEAQAREEAQLYGLAIGVPVGICLLAAAIGAAIYWLKRRKQPPTTNASAGSTAPQKIEVTVS